MFLYEVLNVVHSLGSLVFTSTQVSRLQTSYPDTPF